MFSSPGLLLFYTKSGIKTTYVWDVDGKVCERGIRRAGKISATNERPYTSRPTHVLGVRDAAHKLHHAVDGVVVQDRVVVRHQLCSFFAGNFFGKKSGTWKYLRLERITVKSQHANPVENTRID